jgi:uncharacterized glyoxalase superfamily protein PhnB
VTKNRSAPPGTIVPTIYYEDVGAAIDWLCAAFGFIERYRYGPPKDPAGALLLVGDGSVMLSEARTGQSPKWDDDAELGPGKVITHGISVSVDDVDGHFVRTRQFGAEVLGEPTSYPFGERQYTAVDLAGNRWTFTQSVADVAPEDWGAKVTGT